MTENPAAPPPSVALYTLGAPRIERDGALVHVDTRKAIALLGYLALTGQRHSRDTLAALLWPDYDQPHARGALRRTLSTLHAILPEGWLDASREAIGLSGAARLWLDASVFVALLAQRLEHGHAAAEVCPRCLESLTQAVTLYQDDFLAGFHLRDCERFEDWRLGQSERLRRALASALEALARGYTARRSFGVAIGYARRWLDLDPLHEPAHRLLMKLYFWDGQRSAALRQYHHCAQALTAELGVAPLEATVALYTAIKEQRSPEPPEAPVVKIAAASPLAPTADLAHAPGGANPTATVAAPPTTMNASAHAESLSAPLGAGYRSGVAPAPPLGVVAADLPFVGRVAELAALTSAYATLRQAAARQPGDGARVGGRIGGRLLLVTGEAGIGKTRLANEYLAAARGQGAQVIALHCYEGEAGLAYAPITATLRLAVACGAAGQAQASSGEDQAAPWRGELARLLPEVAPRQATAGRDAHAQARAAGTAQRLADNSDAPVENTVAQSRFYEGLRQALLALCQPHAGNVAHAPAVICLDDIQWADSASLDWLAYLARRLDDYPLCLLLTARSAELAQSPPLQRLLADAQRAGAATVVRLDRLQREDVRGLVLASGLGLHGLTSPTAEPALVTRLYDETEGTPFLLVEYLAALAQGALRADAPEWRLPGGAADLLRARLGAIGETAGQLLATAAVIGRSFDGEIARIVSGRSEDETVQALDELLAHGLITERRAERMTAPTEGPVGGAPGAARATDTRPPTPPDDADRYDFSHAKLRDLVYDETHLARRRLLHRRIAEALATRAARRGAMGAAPTDASAGQIARHYQLAGLDELAADAYLRAGHYARGLYANAEALAHYRATLTLGRGDDPSVREAIGDLLTIQGEYGEALRSYEAALLALCASAPTTAKDPTTQAPTALMAPTAWAAAIIERKLGGVYARRGEWPQAERHLRAALLALGDTTADTLSGDATATGLISHAAADDSQGASTINDQPMSDGLAGDDRVGDATPDAATATPTSPNVLGELLGAQSLRACLYADWSLIAYRQGDGASAHRLAQAALALAEQAESAATANTGAPPTVDARRAQAQAHNMLGMLANSQRAAAEAARHLASSLALAETLGDTGMRAAALNNLALVASGDGDLPRALSLTEQALALCDAQGDRHHEAALANNLADLLHAAGRDDAAMAYLKRAVRIYAEIGVEAGAARLAIWRLSEW